MLKFPDISPNILSGNVMGFHLQVRWYGFFYVLSFICAYIFYRYNTKRRNLKLDKEFYETIIFTVMLGVILGGRFGYVLFYNLPYYLKHPLEILAVWQGGMSFHGGALGVIIGGLILCKKRKFSFYKLADPAIPFVAIGLGLGRLGNFINGELYGKTLASTFSVPWGMVFPNAGELPRHPSQLYEFFFEGVVLFIVSQVLVLKTKKDGIVFWTFIGLYGLFRYFLEFVRQADDLQFYDKYGFIFGFMSIGQVLSIIMLIAGLLWFIINYKKLRA